MTDRIAGDAVSGLPVDPATRGLLVRRGLASSLRAEEYWTAQGWLARGPHQDRVTHPRVAQRAGLRGVTFRWRGLGTATRCPRRRCAGRRGPLAASTSGWQLQRTTRGDCGASIGSRANPVSATSRCGPLTAPGRYKPLTKPPRPGVGRKAASSRRTCSGRGQRGRRVRPPSRVGFDSSFGVVQHGAGA